MFNALNDKFDVESTPEEPKDIVPIAVQNTDLTTLEQDTETARDSLQKLMKKGSDAVDEILNVASASEHPRAYEVAGQLIKTMSEVAKDLVNIHKIKKDTERSDAPKAATIGKQTNVFVGSTTELMKYMKTNQIEATATIAEDK
jgi:hypothetical protein